MKIPFWFVVRGGNLKHFPFRECHFRAEQVAQPRLGFEAGEVQLDARRWRPRGGPAEAGGGHLIN